MSFTRKVGLLSVVSLGGVIASLAYTICIAYIFGVSKDVEIYFASSQVFIVFVTIAQAGQLTEAFVPVFQRIKVKQGQLEAFRAVSVMLNWLLLVGASFAAVIYFVAAYIVSIQVSGFSVEDKLIVEEVVKLLCPLIVVQVALSFLKGIGNAQKIFFWPEFLNLLGSIVNLVVVLLCASLGVWALVYGLMVSVVFQLVGMLVVFYMAGYRYRPILKTDLFEVSMIFKKLGSTSLYSVCAQVSAIAMTSMLSNLPQGVLGAYNYALRMFSKIGSVILRPISIVFFAHFSEAFAKGSEKLSDLSRNALDKSLALIMLTFITAFSSGEYLLKGVLVNANFPSEMVALTFTFITFYIASFFFAGFAQIARKIIVTIGLFDLQYAALSVGRLLLAGLTVYLISTFSEFGVMMVICAGTAINALLSFLILKVKNNEMLAFYRWSELIKWFLIAALVTLMVKGIEYFVFIDYAHSAVRFENVFVGAALLVLSFAFTIFFARLFNVNEVNTLLGGISSFIAKFFKKKTGVY